MKNDRTRIPVDQPYLGALGIATYSFATMEWNAVWCCEKMSPGYIQGVDRKTAGQIAGDFISLARKWPDAAQRSDIEKGAFEFARLVKVRNGIMHGKPGTAPGGEQRLFRDGTPWSIAMLEDAADEFAACGIELNGLMYGHLK